MKRRGFLKSLAGLLAAPAALAAMPVPSLPAIKTTGWAIDPPLLRAGETITITSGGKTITETTSSGPMAYVNGNGNGYGYLCTDNGHGHYSVTIPASETR